MKTFEGFVDIYSGEAYTPKEVEGKLPEGKPVVNDKGTLLQVYCCAEDARSASGKIADAYQEYIETPISELNRKYGRQPLGQKQ